MNHTDRAGARRPGSYFVEPLEVRRLWSGEYAGSTVIGGAGSERIDHVYVDVAGNRTVIGTFTGKAAFAPGKSTYAMSSVGAADIFVARYSPSNRLIWARQVGGAGVDEPGNVAADADGNVYVVGSFTGTTDFDPTKAGQALRTSAGKTDVFVWKLSPRGYLDWVAIAGGANYDIARDVGVNPNNGDAYVVGWTTGAVDFSRGAPLGGINGVPFAHNSASRDGYIWHLTGAGQVNRLQDVGGPGDDRVVAVATRRVPRRLNFTNSAS